MTFAAVLCTAFFAIACTKEKVRPDDPDGPQGLSELVVEGPWKVALFIDDGDDDTAYFDGYSFAFQADGEVRATRRGSDRTVDGAWRTRFDDGRVELWLNFRTDRDEFRELSEDWYLIDATNDRIRLEYDDDDDDLYLLTFERL